MLQKSILISFCLMLSFPTLLFESLIAEESMARYTTCAVYHRMMVGAMRRKGNLGALIEEHMEKMNRFVELAKRSGEEEYGKELGEEMFNEEWTTIQSEMTDQINRNYNNISRLRLRYKASCKIQP